MTPPTLEHPVSWRPRLPEHLKQRVPAGEALSAVQEELKKHSLPTVCEEAKCPNRTDCWARGTLTFQILGSVCTRRCGFCAETTGRPGSADLSEPRKLADAAAALKLKHVVITSPARDDMADQGAGQFAASIRSLRERLPEVTIEVLTPDFQGRPDLLKIVFDARPDVFNHNLETVRRLTPAVRGRATYDRSLAVLEAAVKAGLKAKSGLMVGLGETEDELHQAFRDLSGRGVKALTVGQYLPPSPLHYPVARFYGLDEFETLKKAAAPHFENAMIGPLVRSSYHADEMI